VNQIKIIVLLFFVLFGVAPTSFAATPGEIMAGENLREARLDGLLGGAAKFSDFRGKPLLINVWASWCGPCRAEMGSLERLARRYGGKEFNVIGISTDDDRIAAQGFLWFAKISFPNYIDHQLVLENMLGANKIPLTILVDAEGRIVRKIAGAKTWDAPESVEMIQRAFREKPGSQTSNKIGNP
jgi:thiol-disulfide isomerase/thioredoxin